MMKLKTRLTTLAFLTAALLPCSSLAAELVHFCRDDQTASYGGPDISNSDLTADDCVEIGAYNYGGENGYAVTARNVNILSGNRMSVLGFLLDSTVNSGAEVYVTKDAQIAEDGFYPSLSATLPATASGITVYSGGLVCAYDGGTLKNSRLDGGKAYISNTVKFGWAGKSTDNEAINGGMIVVYLGGVSNGPVISQGGYEYIQQAGNSVGAQISDGGGQYVITSGVADSATVNAGGAQHVYNGGSAGGTTINADGNQYVYNTGVVSNAVVNNGGAQYLYACGSGPQSTIAGVAHNTALYGNGVQHILNGGRASFVTLNDSAAQSVYTGSSADNVTLNGTATQGVDTGATTENVTLNDDAKSWLRSGATMTGTTQINDRGQLVLATGAGAESVSLNSGEASLQVVAGSREGDVATTGHLSGTGSVRFITAGGAGPPVATTPRCTPD